MRTGAPAAPPTLAVVLAAGLGTRMRQADPAALLDAAQAAAAGRGSKALIPIPAAGPAAGRAPDVPARPFLDYGLHALAEAGWCDVCLVIGPGHDAIRHYYEQQHLRRLRIRFAVQAEPRGTADAVLAAESVVRGGRFLVINGDNVYPPPALASLRGLPGCGLVAFERGGMLAAGIPAERLLRFALVEVGSDGCLRRIVEKPDSAAAGELGPQALISMNCWLFGPSIFEACRRIDPSPRGELELTDAVQFAYERLGERFRVVTSSEPVLDLSSRADVATVAARLAATEVNL